MTHTPTDYCPFEFLATSDATHPFVNALDAFVTAKGGILNIFGQNP